MSVAGSIQIPEDEWHMRLGNATNVAKVDAIFASQTKSHQYAVNDLAAAKLKCAIVMNKITGPARDVISKELKIEDYHGAYKALNLHFIKQGVSKLVIREESILKVIIQPGTALETWKLEFNNALVEIASVKKIKDFHHRGNRLEDFNLNTEEMKDNYGIMTDMEFRAKHGCDPIISEFTRFEYIMNGLTGCERFASTIAL